MVKSGMRDAGYTYVNLDDCWGGYVAHFVDKTCLIVLPSVLAITTGIWQRTNRDSLLAHWSLLLTTFIRLAWSLVYVIHCCSIHIPTTFDRSTFVREISRARVTDQGRGDTTMTTLKLWPTGTSTWSRWTSATTLPCLQSKSTVSVNRWQLSFRARY